MRNELPRVWLWAIFLNVTGIIYATVFPTGCGGPDKPIVQPNPDFANCSADKSIVENQCLKDNPTREGFDACIAAKRKSCIDGGAP